MTVLRDWLDRWYLLVRLCCCCKNGAGDRTVLQLQHLNALILCVCILKEQGGVCPQDMSLVARNTNTMSTAAATVRWRLTTVAQHTAAIFRTTTVSNAAAARRGSNWLGAPAFSSWTPLRNNKTVVPVWTVASSIQPVTFGLQRRSVQGPRYSTTVSLFSTMAPRGRRRRRKGAGGMEDSPSKPLLQVQPAPNNRPPMVKVALMGPPNAGKSTLYNRLLDKAINKTYRLATSKIKSPTKSGRRRSRRDKGRFAAYLSQGNSYEPGMAIVSKVPGTTRDRRTGIGRIGGVFFKLMDTAGIDGERLDVYTNKTKNHQQQQQQDNAFDDETDPSSAAMVNLQESSPAERHAWMNKRHAKGGSKRRRESKRRFSKQNPKPKGQLPSRPGQMRRQLRQLQKYQEQGHATHVINVQRHADGSVRNATNTLTNINNAAMTPRELIKPMIQQALLAAQEAHVILFLFDAKVGITADFQQTCKWLRRLSTKPILESRNADKYRFLDEDMMQHDGNDEEEKNRHKVPRRRKILLLGNKLEGTHWTSQPDSPVHDHLEEASWAGLGTAIPISALHGDGLAEVAVEIHKVQQELILEWEQERQAKREQEQKPLLLEHEPKFLLPEGEGMNEHEHHDMEAEDTDMRFLDEDLLAEMGGKSQKPSQLDERNDGDVYDNKDDAGAKDKADEKQVDFSSMDPESIEVPHVDYFLTNNDDDTDQEGKSQKEKILQLAILGRVNVGKSSLVNALLKEDRVITGAMPGMTRDAIAIEWSYQGRPVQLVDTAGLRKPSKRTDEEIEEMAVMDAMRAMKVANVAVLVLDAGARMLRRQELAICETVLNEGRALVVAANKLDLVCDSYDYTAKDFEEGVRNQLEGRFPMLRNTPIIPTSALTGEGVEDLMPAVFSARDRWSQTIPSSKLNKWLQEVVDEHAPPLIEGRRPTRIKYMVQTKGRPPTFLLFCNTLELPESYIRYLTRQFQESFDYYGMNVRLVVKPSATSNPYEHLSRERTRRQGFGLGGKVFRFKRQWAIFKRTGSKKKERKRGRRKIRFARYH